jgi:predicted GH43/DUF377 family glycosyl hydrolase
MKLIRPGNLIPLLIIFCSAAHAEDANVPKSLTSWTPLSKTAIFVGNPESWDKKIRERGWIIQEKDEWKLWYTGYDGSKDGIRRVGYATSSDGLTWKRHPKPLLESLWVEDMVVLKDPDENRYLMFAEGEKDRAHWLTSKDGIDWKAQGRLNVRLKNGMPIPDGAFGTPFVMKDNGRWLLFYERSDLGIWVAESKDLKTWLHVQDEPIMKPGPDEPDHDLIALNQIIRHDGKFFAIYHGTKSTGPLARKWSTCLATSSDLLHWQKYPKNPLLPTELNQSSGLLVPMPKGFRLYTMHPEVYVYQSE